MTKLKIRSRNTSCQPLRRSIEMPRQYYGVYYMGSTTPLERVFPRRSLRPDFMDHLVMINSPEACAISGDKQKFHDVLSHTECHVADYSVITEVDDVDSFGDVLDEKYFSQNCSVIVKHRNSSKGRGIFLLKNLDEYFEWAASHSLEYMSCCVFERYYSYSKEYRLHVTEDGCFYACRKMLRNDAEDRWHRHESNSVWILEENEMFQKPASWDDIVADCVSALKAMGLDIAAFDVKVQNATHEYPKWIIMESNSAPALGEVGIEKYKSQLQTIILKKAHNEN